MSKKLNKIIMDDFNKTYSIELDKEKIYKNIQVKEDNIQTVLYFKRLCKRISAAACLIIVCLIAVIGVMAVNDYKDGNSDVVTKEFEEYMEEYSGVDKYTINSLFQIQDSVYLYVYEANNEIIDKEIYFFIVKNDLEKNNCILKINKKEILLKKGSYGLLCEFSKDDTNKDICFSIEYNGKITDYKIG